PEPDEEDQELSNTAEQADLFLYDFEQHRILLVAEDVSEVQLAKRGEFLFFRCGDEILRVYDALEEISELEEEVAAPVLEYSRRSGLVELGDIKVAVNPPDEWWQMLRETWRLQGQHFWDPGLTGVDWDLVWKRYAALLPRVRTRVELSDLIWEMQGELN